MTFALVAAVAWASCIGAASPLVKPPVTAGPFRLVTVRQELRRFPVAAPDSEPAWIRHDSSFTPRGILKRVLAVEFHPGASPSSRAAAIDSVRGTAIGGFYLSFAQGAEGTYYVRVPWADSGDSLVAAIRTMERQPAVRNAVLLSTMALHGRRLDVRRGRAMANAGRERAQVPATAPDSAPAWFVDDTSWTSDGALKRAAEVRFRNGASVAARSAAIDSVGGIVIGGYTLPNDVEGTYYVLIPSATSDLALLVALQTLSRQPGVAVAGFKLRYRVDAGRLNERWTRIAPDTQPAWLNHDSSYAEGVAKAVLGVRFKATATPQDRIAAIDSVGGSVIGGLNPFPATGAGWYLVHMPDVVNRAAPKARRAVLERQAGVGRVIYLIRMVLH